MDERMQQRYREYLERFEYFGKSGTDRLDREEFAMLVELELALRDSAASEDRARVAEIRRILLTD